jgi:acyl-CoA thioester hydrolase
MPHRWFDYKVRVQPHHTDYSGVVWHGTYIQWMESARVECLREVHFAFEEFVKAGYDLPVVDMQLRYHQPLQMGMEAVVKTRLATQRGVRLNWLYEIQTLEDRPQLCITGQVTLVAIDLAKRKIVRRLPTELQGMIDGLSRYFVSEF